MQRLLFHVFPGKFYILSGHARSLSLSLRTLPTEELRVESLEERLSWRILTVPNSFVVMVPSPSLSNRENASLNSAICSSVS